MARLGEVQTPPELGLVCKACPLQSLAGLLEGFTTGAVPCDVRAPAAHLVSACRTRLGLHGPLPGMGSTVSTLGVILTRARGTLIS